MHNEWAMIYIIRNKLDASFFCQLPIVIIHAAIKRTTRMHKSSVMDNNERNGKRSRFVRTIICVFNLFFSDVLIFIMIHFYR